MDKGFTLAPKWLLALDCLQQEDRASLVGAMKRLAVPSRCSLFRQGDFSDRLIVLDAGRVRIFQTSESGEEFTLGVCVGGSTIGLAPLLLGAPRNTSAETLDDSSISVLGHVDFERFLQAMPSFGAGLARLLATMAIESSAHCGSLAQDSARVRLGTTLLSLARNSDSQAAQPQFHVSGITQEDLARIVGVSRTWVALTLGLLEERGLIVKKKRLIAIPDMERLAGFVSQERVCH
jgi:CRP-like cAMP-binding protein